MRKFLREHVTTVFIFLAALFLGIIIAEFSWGIGFMTTSINTAVNPKAQSQQTPGYDLPGAAALNYRGTLQQ